MSTNNFTRKFALLRGSENGIRDVGDGSRRIGESMREKVAEILTNKATSVRGGAHRIGQDTLHSWIPQFSGQVDVISIRIDSLEFHLAY